MELSKNKQKITTHVGPLLGDPILIFRCWMLWESLQSCHYVLHKNENAQGKGGVKGGGYMKIIWTPQNGLSHVATPLIRPGFI